MGRDKATIEIEGRSLLRRVYDAAEPCCSKIYVVTHQSEVYRPLLPNTCRWIQEKSEQGDRLFGGPLIGFAQALNHVESDWYLLLACDLPFLDSKILNLWVKQAVDDGSPPIARVPFLNGRWEPLCALYHQECRNSLQSFVLSGGRSFQTWLNTQSLQAITVLNPKMLHNCNTPSDLRADL